MKNICFPPLICLFAFAWAFISCTLDTEPEIPAGVNNFEEPAFLSADIHPDTNYILANARLSSTGNLDIQQHGWVWSENPNPTIQNDSLDLGQLELDSYSAKITGLVAGKVYYLRPFLTTGCGTVYGEEFCSFVGLRFSINTDKEIFQGADVQFNADLLDNCSYSWDFGGNSAASGRTPKHTFGNIGAITVRLTAAIDGCTATKDLVLNVIPDPFQDYWAPVGSGTFMMGCTPGQAPCESDMLPSHEVTLGYSFDIGNTEITQRQWEAVMGENPSSFKQCGPDCPVESVSWNDITGKFIPALDRKTGRQHRLPTEAEWEYAARGGQAFRYSGSNDLVEVGWYSYNSDATPHPVDSLQPNGFALKDMSGNVWEWVADDYHPYYNGAPQDGSAWIGTPPGSNRVFRGGSWKEGFAYCRVAYRSYNSPAFKADNLGFRIARP